MTSKLKSIFSKGSKSRADSDPKPSYTKLESSSDSLYSVQTTQTTQTTDVSEEKRKAWEAKRMKAAEDYLYKNGYGMIFPTIRV